MEEMHDRAYNLKQTRVLLDYMLRHNEYYYKNMVGLVGLLPEKSQEELLAVIGSYESANNDLQKLLDSLAPAGQSDAGENQPAAASHGHGHYHDPKEKMRQINRLSRVIGHLQYVKRMMEKDEDCADVLMQISASKSALNGLGKEIINEHLSHCITHAIEDGDTKAVEEFQEAIQRFI